jgi:hypothetical protein
MEYTSLQNPVAPIEAVKIYEGKTILRLATGSDGFIG